MTLMSVFGVETVFVTDMLNVIYISFRFTLNGKKISTKLHGITLALASVIRVVTLSYGNPQV